MSLMNNRTFCIDTQTFNSTTVLFKLKGHKITPIVIPFINSNKWIFSSSIYRDTPGHYELYKDLPSFKCWNAKITWAGNHPNPHLKDFFGAVGENWFDLKSQEGGREAIVVEGFWHGHNTDKKGQFLYNIVGNGRWADDLGLSSLAERRKYAILGDLELHEEDQYREKLNKEPLTPRAQKFMFE
ncbi:uncharacterized protein P174DRAFT_445767 [Aspergillus novofumigatus IBT 16806]|uniref:Uncharacterized protein n=1 Tax=Aspergillus novofumigatus (strain IBT 16806) TaxID=1392255 RepID=A0A2I1BUV4_ASPN1|nr:uncharacterized protein P174DRAFT_445767 [Aspergillus novofumigatus IBT 16806]PKX89146.1 hypothetical protein P174DRAFT_445767 [Aspergillus novofumigatus IBT 16806]